VCTPSQSVHSFEDCLACAHELTEQSELFEQVTSSIWKVKTYLVIKGHCSCLFHVRTGKQYQLVSHTGLSTEEGDEVSADSEAVTQRTMSLL
jgi:hypothetical protein